MRIDSLNGVLLAAAMLNSGCGDQSHLTSPTNQSNELTSPIDAGPDAAVVQHPQVIVTRDKFAAADYFIETDCTLTEIFFVGVTEGRLADRSQTFENSVFVTLDEFDNCNFTESFWFGSVSSAFTQKGLISAAVSTPITLTNSATGETRSFTLNAKWKGTTEQSVDAGHGNNLSEGERFLINFSSASRVADVTTAELIDASSTNLLADAQLSFANIGLSHTGTITITYP